MNLIERIDIALSHARKSRGELASHCGISVQAISNLKRRPGSTMRPENVAHMARYLKCDLYWLCTGEGDDEYVPDGVAPTHSFIAAEVARFLDSMTEGDRARAFALVYAMARGQWPPSGNGHARNDSDYRA
jgi:hypothetical protein